MAPAEGLRVELVASEPLVRQPVAIEFDDRGRLWVIQYLQYPNPAGLQRVEWDRYSRTKYDRIPEPPPHGPRGADRITILSDTDGDGLMDSARDFVNGLNLATGLAFGHGGVFVLQVPYLLFYADRDRDDVPDGPPDVLLTGFGMEDAHSVANSLTWGPDGWLYGAQGSTVTANIRGIEFQQGVWRYHPPTARFELFYEGGGNTWGLDFDDEGNLLASTNVGGYVALHGVQGGYYWKSFGKHGALHHPHAYGYFEHIRHEGFQGGHVGVGGIVYQGRALPEAWRGSYVVANLLSHNVQWHRLESEGSTFVSRYGGTLVESNDTWFAPCDVTMGPDEALYVADWHDRRTAHPDPDAEWDRSNGRIFRIVQGASPPPRDLDLFDRDSAALADLLAGSSVWHTRWARQILAGRSDSGVRALLRSRFDQAFERTRSAGPAESSADDRAALEYFWGCAACRACDDELALRALAHRHAPVRAWAVRIMGDGNQISTAVGEAFCRLAQTDDSPRVRSQLASTARRLPAPVAIPLATELASRDEDSDDPLLPLLVWWAFEAHAVEGRESVLARFTDLEFCRRPMVRRHLFARLVRRYAAENHPDGWQAVADLWDVAEPAGLAGEVWLALDQAATAPKRHEVPERLRTRVARAISGAPDPLRLRIAVRWGEPVAARRAAELAADPQMPSELRLGLIALLPEAGVERFADELLHVARTDRAEEVRIAALRALASCGDEQIAGAVLNWLDDSSPAVRSAALDLLTARASWAATLLEAVARGDLAPSDLSTDHLRRLSLLDDAAIDDAVRRQWGTVRAATPEERLAEVRRLNNDLRAGPGDVHRGRRIYREHCANCHRLFGEGHLVGPDLTTANRQDREFLLISLVDPNAVIRKEYLNHTLATGGGRIVSGILLEETATHVTLLAPRGEQIRIAVEEVERLEVAADSLMPSDLVAKLSPADVRDLFAFLQTPDPPVDGE